MENAKQDWRIRCLEQRFNENRLTPANVREIARLVDSPNPEVRPRAAALLQLVDKRVAA